MVDISGCTDCGICTRRCVFLDKYDINLKDYASLPDLAYHCYLCNECTRVCPEDIDGRQISLDLREEKQVAGYNLYTNGYGPLILEKRNYIFKNYRRSYDKMAFFPGCNFPAYYQETTNLLSSKLKENFNISTIFDCCGRPMAQLNLEKESQTVTDRLNHRIKELGIEEIITVCPNCYYHFKDSLDVEVSMIYEHEEIMDSLIVGESTDSIEGRLFLPCPDRDDKNIYKMIEKYLNKDKLKQIRKIQCCGAGGSASIKEKDLTKNLQDGFKEYDEKIYVYCATCAGMITKSNPHVEHILCKLLDTNEEVSAGIKSLKNRAVFSIKGGA